MDKRQALVNEDTLQLQYSIFIFDCPSPTASSSLSPPPPMGAAMSFDQFSPVGGIDPFAPSMVTSSDASNAYYVKLMGELLQPSLPFDEDIAHSM